MFARLSSGVLVSALVLGTAAAHAAPSVRHAAPTADAAFLKLIAHLPPWQGRLTYQRAYHRQASSPLVNSPIKHVVVVIMENRTPDNLFSAYYTAGWQNNLSVPFPSQYHIIDPNHPPAPIASPLQPLALSDTGDPDHGHGDYVNESTKGWANIKPKCSSPPCTAQGVTTFIRANIAYPYEQMLFNWSSGDYVFQGNQGPSFPAHQYLIAGQSGGWNNNNGMLPNLSPYAMDENVVAGGTGPVPDDPSDPAIEPWITGAGPYCSPPPVKPPYVATINMLGPYNQNEKSNPTPLPCDNYSTIFDNLGAPSGLPPNGLLWEYHAHKVASYWDAPSAINRFANPPNGNGQSVPNNFADPWANQFYSKDIVPNNMPDVAFLTPCPYDSDHPNNTSDDGPGWVAWLVNAIGTNTTKDQNGQTLWSNTAIFVVWDDWGAWYDDVPPGQLTNDIYCQLAGTCGQKGYQDPNEWGFRVPLIAISAYPAYGPNGTPGGHVSHTVRSSTSILDFIEANFGLPSMGTDDSQNDNLADMFDFQDNIYPGIPFTPISVNAGYQFSGHYNAKGQPICPSASQH